ncbi:PFL_4695 family integrating conjugative element protein [Cysteiniphilum marinum]|uniref:PFL_4695 family integrating conjugative element protein n=1 Tax=Cysteiniphilum marinum TaxID=2774191 RepID=UPI001939D7D9|nr:integrating conjugative element protein [Cysteiniphilum marinum]
MSVSGILKSSKSYFLHFVTCSLFTIGGLSTIQASTLATSTPINPIKPTDLVVIKDYGNTEDIADYVDIGKLGRVDSITNNSNDLLQQERLMQSAVSQAKTAMYQVSTPNMTVGKVESQEIATVEGFSQNFFVVGCDEISRKWLLFYQAQLSELSAVGYVVNCDSQGDFQTLKSAINLPLMVIKGDLFVQKFSVSHYPFLVTENYLSQ